MKHGERQVAPTLDGIRRDHAARYEWVAKHLKPESRVIDFACGVGYGAKILANAGHRVFAYDRDAEAVQYAETNYAHSAITYRIADANCPPRFQSCDAAVCFETIEHLKRPEILLSSLSQAVPTLYASVPNEDEFPYMGYIHHYRHYRRAECDELLRDCGWKPGEWYGQTGAESEVDPEVKGRTLLCVAEAVRIPSEITVVPADQKIADQIKKKPPRHVAIVALGYTAEAYVERVKHICSRKAFCDETWAINGMGDVIACDLIFHMDDVRIQEIRAAARPNSAIANMLTWLKTTTTPVMTSRAYPDYPALVEFPLEDVINDLGMYYFNNTVAYAMAYAIHIGVEKVSIFGCDYTYPNAHKSERGRGCLEFWLGYATRKGVEIAVPERTTLMDARDNHGDHDAPLYGYDTLTVSVEEGEDGTVTVKKTPKDTLPTAEQIEAAYDHQQHPAKQKRAAS